MPFIHIRISGVADEGLSRRIAAEASELTQRLLGKDPALTAVVVDYVGAPHWFIAGRPLVAESTRSYHWRVSITDEANTRREKASYLRAVHEAMTVLLEGAAEHSYTEVADLRGSAYGYGGKTQEHRFQHPALEAL